MLSLERSVQFEVGVWGRALGRINKAEEQFLPSACPEHLLAVGPKAKYLTDFFFVFFFFFFFFLSFFGPHPPHMEVPRLGGL